MPWYVPSSPASVISAPGRQGATRWTSISASQTVSSGASTSKDCSSFIAYRLQVFGGVDVQVRGEPAHLEELPALVAQAGVAAELTRAADEPRAQARRMAGDAVV